MPNTLDLLNDANALAVVGQYAYAVSDMLYIMDISDPDNPVLKGSCEISNGQAVQVVGDYAYVADGSSGLQIINISNPDNPTLTANYNTPGNAKAVAVVGNYAYVADGYSGLQIINISTPNTPTLTANYNTPGYADAVNVVGHYAFVANSQGISTIIDASAFVPANPPTNITLSNSNIAENQDIGTVIGNFSSTDPDDLNSFTYRLVTGTGATDNSVFAIIDNQLTTNSVFDYETKNSYSIRVRTTDQGGLFFEKVLTIGVTDVNEAPTDLTLSNSSPSNLLIDISTVAENQDIGTVVGNLTTTDPDANNTFTYSLVSGTGATDNSVFAITNNQLTTNSVFDYETKNSYSIRVRTTDQGGLFFEKELTIGVSNVNETPTNLFIDTSTVAENQVIGTVVGTFGSTDQDANNTFTYSLVSGTGATDNSVFAILGNHLTTNSVFNYETKNSYSIRVRTTDQGGLSFEKVLTIGVNDLNEITGNPSINNGRTPIVGTAGSDWITGGSGAKTITGGLGNDFFVFTDLRDAGQRITDFTVGEDKIVLTQLLGTISSSEFDPITDGYIRFVAGTGSNTGSTFLQIDRDGISGSAIFRNFLQVDTITTTQLNNVDNFVF